MTGPTRQPCDTREMVGTGRLARAPGVLWRNTLGGVLISTAEDVDPMLCTSPTEVVWELLADPITMDDLCDRLAEMYHVPVAVVATDLSPMLDSLLAAGAVVEVD